MSTDLLSHKTTTAGFLGSISILVMGLKIRDSHILFFSLVF